MAVEIPVVIDIDKAFKDAANRVPNAMKPLQQSIEQLTSDLSKFKEKLEASSAGSKAFEQAAQKVMQLEEAIDLVNSRINQFTTRSGSINRLSGDLAVIQQQFERMGSTQMFDATGNLSADAKKLQQDYARVAQELDKVRSILVAEYEAQVKARQEADAQAKAAAEHRQALTMTATTLSQLNTQLAAWKKELANASQGSVAFTTAAQRAGELERKIALLNSDMKELGMQSGSIDRLRTALQGINMQYQALSGSDRKGAAGKALLNSYRALSQQLDKEVKDLQQIVDLEKRISEMSAQRSRTRQYENAVLNSTANTMHRLSEQARILSERLERAKFGTKNFEELKKKLEDVQRKINEVRGSTNNVTTALNNQSTVMRNLTSYASMYVSVFGAVRFIKSIRDVTAELEYQRISLGRLIQDMDYGNVLFDKIKESAKESPFRIKDLVTYTKQLAAYQIEEEKLFDTTKRLADISAGLGVDMNRLILAYGQVRAASVLRGQELRQFTEAGIPLVELLADKMGELNKQSYTTADVFKLISARAVPFSAIAEIFEDLTDKGGMFYKMQEEQAKTLKGRWEKLKDVYDIALQSIGESKGLLSFTTYNDLVLKGLNALAGGLRVVPKLLEGGSLAWMVYRAATIKSRAAIRAARIEEVKRTFATDAAALAQLKGVKNVNAYTAALIRQKAATTMLGRSFYALKAAIIANPWGAAVAAVLGLATAFLSFRKSTDKAATDVAQFTEAVSGLAEIDKRFSKNQKLIETYEELATKTDLTDKENKKLHSTMSKLADLFPTLTSLINDETRSIQDNVKALQDKNEEQRNAAIQETQDRLNAAKATKDRLERELRAQEEERRKAAETLETVQKIHKEAGTASTLKDVDRFTEKYNELDKKVQELRGNLESVNESIEAFENFLNPKEVDETITAWKELVKERNDYETSLGKVPLFAPQEIDDLESVYDLYKKLKKIWTESKESAEGLYEAYIKATEPISKGLLYNEWKDEEAKFKQSDFLRAFFGFDFKSSGSKSSSYTQDPFIAQMQERIKFMQDFKKGYDDLNKYMDKAQALQREGDIMLTRGLSLGMSAEEQRRAAAGLSQWYEGAIKDAFVQAQKHGAKGTLEQFLSQEIKDTSNKGKALKDFQKLIQSLWDAKTDVDTSQLKKDLEDAIKRLSDEVKRSETVRNFYQDILGLTGDEELASSISVSVYGGIGQDFQERLQRQLDEALKSLDADQLTDELRQAFTGRDFETILKNIEKFPEKWQEQLKEMAEADEKYNADRARELLKALEQAKSYGDQRVQLAKETARRTAEIEQMNAPEDIKAQLLKQNRKKEAEEAAKLEYEAFKETPMYVELFADLDEASARMLNNMRENLIALKTQWKDLNPRDLKELQSRINELDEQIARRNPFKALISSIKEYRELQSSTPRAEADEAAITANERLATEKETLAQLTAQYEEVVAKNKMDSEAVKIAKEKMEKQAKVVDEAEDEAKAAQKIANSYRLAAKHIMDAAEGLIEWSSNIKSALDGVGDIIDVFASNDFTETFGVIAEGTAKTLEGAGKTTMGLVKLFSGTDIVGGIMSLISGISDLFTGIAGTAKNLSIRQLNKQIKEQGRLIEDLEESYDSLSAALDRAFGNERIYNFNKMMEVMAAEMEAYRNQAEAERAKGKKADEDTALGYDRSAREIEQKMRELRDQQEAFFAGSDLSSSAEAFADAWLSAYQEFGDTSQAIEERMTEMVQNLMKKAALSGIAQNILGNWYDSLADVEDWNAQTIAEKWKEAMELVSPMVEGMQVFANSMQAEGISLRNTVGQFTGISRDIAGASEESINGLAAGINTQNFYMSFVPMIHENVAQILTYMTGGNTVTPATQSGIEGMPSVQTIVYNNLPAIRSDISDVLQLLKSVISVGNVPPRNYVAIK